MTTYAQQIAERDRQIAAAAIEAAARNAEQSESRHHAAARIRALDLDAIIASVPVPELPADERERFEAAMQSLPALGLRHIDAKQNRRGLSYLHNGLADTWEGWQAAKHDALTQARELTDAEIRAVFLRNGFTIKEGHSDLKPYVYQAARALLSASKGEK